MTGKRPARAKAEEAPWTADETLAAAMASLDLAAPPLEPPPGLWDGIEQALDAGRAADLGVSVIRFGEGRWREIAPGVSMKRMWDRRTVLLRCEPGAFVPDHEHREAEHALVLSGDLVSEFGSFTAGDYHRVPAGGTHQAWTTLTGCVVLVQYAA